MRTDVPAFADPTLQSRAGATVTLYTAASPLDLIAGTEGLTTRDLTPYATRITHTATEASVTLQWHSELDGVARPVTGQMVRLALGAYPVFTGHIDSISGDRVSREGAKTCSITVRRRDATAWWRDVRRVSGVYSVGVDLASIARDVAGSLGLTAAEYDLPDTGIALAHESAQLSDLNAWDALTLCLAPGLREPLVDGRGILKSLDRNVTRPVDLVIPLEQVKEITNSTSRPPLTVYRVKWLDPAATRIDQQDQVLTRSPVSITVGFFHQSSDVPIWWSEDHTQQADLTYRREIQAAVQSPLSSFWGGNFHCTYTQDSMYGGTLHVSMDVGEAMAEIILDIALIAAGHYLEDIPIVGKLLGGAMEAAAIGDALMLLTKQAIGVYEVRGVPFAFVHPVNETEAYDADAETWRYQFEETENDLVPNEEVADSYAANELIYRARAASKAGLVIADDLRIEQGDMVGLEDARKFYVQDISRDLTRGAEALLSLSGFWL